MQMDRAYYSDTINNFIITSPNEILGQLSRKSEFADEITQKGAWREEIRILKKILPRYDGQIYFEFSVPRMGKRIDVLIIIKSVIFILEFKVGKTEFDNYSIDQVVDYALDMKNFHETSHDKTLAPILICTQAPNTDQFFAIASHHDQILNPILSNQETLGFFIKEVIKYYEDENYIDVES